MNETIVEKIWLLFNRWVNICWTYYVPDTSVQWECRVEESLVLF